MRPYLSRNCRIAGRTWIFSNALFFDDSILHTKSKEKNRRACSVLFFWPSVSMAGIEKAEREREELKGTDKKHIYLARAESWDGGAAGLNYMHRYLPYKKPARHLP
jgi:hypothetical protein